MIESINILKCFKLCCEYVCSEKNDYCYDYWYLDFGISNIFFDYVNSEKSKPQSDGTS